MARRNGSVGGNDGNPVRVTFDGEEIFPFTLYDNPTWKTFISRPFLPSNSSGLLRFEGGNPSGDRSELIDWVRIFENTDLLPDNVVVQRGRQISGGLASLFSSDDVRLEVAPALNVDQQSAPVEVLIETTSPWWGIAYLALTLESSASMSG